jgi:hypothetical protein
MLWSLFDSLGILLEFSWNSLGILLNPGRGQSAARVTTHFADGCSRGTAATERRPGANVERAQGIAKERDAVKTFFLGIFTRCAEAIFAHGTLPRNPIAWRQWGLRLADKPTKNSGVMIVAFAAVAGWQIYDMATATEAPSRALYILQYVLLVALLVGLVGALLNFVRSQ